MGSGDVEVLEAVKIESTACITVGYDQKEKPARSGEYKGCEAIQVL